MTDILLALVVIVLNLVLGVGIALARRAQQQRMGQNRPPHTAGSFSPPTHQQGPQNQSRMVMLLLIMGGLVAAGVLGAVLLVPQDTGEAPPTDTTEMPIALTVIIAVLMTGLIVVLMAYKRRMFEEHSDLQEPIPHYPGSDPTTETTDAWRGVWPEEDAMDDSAAVQQRVMVLVLTAVSLMLLLGCGIMAWILINL